MSIPPRLPALGPAEAAYTTRLIQGHLQASPEERVPGIARELERELAATMVRQRLPRYEELGALGPRIGPVNCQERRAQRARARRSR